MRGGAGLRLDRFRIPAIGGHAHVVRMIPNEKTTYGQTHGHQDTEDHVSGLPAPHKNHPGDHWRENKRSNAIAGHHDAHDQATTSVEPPRDQRGGGQEKSAAPYGSDKPVPEIKRFDRCCRTRHVDAKTVDEGAQEENKAHAMGMEEGTDNQDPNTGDHRRERIGEGQGTV